MIFQIGFKELIPNNIHFILDSILDKNTLDKVFNENKIDLVIHLAAKTSAAESILKPSKYWETNLSGNSNLLIAMKNNNLKKIIFHQLQSFMVKYHHQQLMKLMITFQLIHMEVLN